MSGTILVIVPSYNERENIVQLAHAILEQSPEIDVLVVDDHSPDGTSDLVRAEEPKCHGRLKLLSRKGKGGRGSAVLAGLSPFAMPLPTTKRVMIRCAAIGQTSVTVPAPYMAAIMTSGYRRIQATFMRPALMSGGPATVNALSGHAIVGFTNRPAQ